MSLNNIVQIKSVASGAAVTISATLDSAVTSGNTLLAIHWGDGEAVATNPPEPWTQISYYDGGALYRRATVFKLLATGSTGQTHTFELSNGLSKFCNLILLEIEGLNSISVPGSTDAGSVTSISMPASGGLSGLTVGRTLLTCITGSSGTWDGYTQPSGYTLVDSSAGGSLAGKEITATTEPEAVHSWGSSANNAVALGIELDLQDPNAPTITNINTNNEVTPGATATLTGTNLTGATGFSIGPEAQTAFTVVNDTTATFTVVRGGNPYNQNLTGTLLHPDGNQTITVQQVPAEGFAVTAASPNTTDDASLWSGLVDTSTGDPVTVVDGDQALVTDPNNLGNLAVTPAGEISADTEGDFTVQFWRASEGVWGSDQTVTFQVPDETAPTATSVGVPTAGNYAAGQNLDLTVNASKTVTVTTTGGTPSIPVTIGATVRQATYVSGSGTSALLFRYTTQAGDNDGDGISVGSSISLNGGTIQDGASNNLVLTLNSIGDTSGVLVDTVKPVITPNGANPVNVVVGGTYTDAGATATDNIDGSLGSVAGTGSVDTNTIGQYTITYPGAGVVDSAGNVAEDATRTVNVVSEDPWPFGKSIKYAATKNWEWGKRHPKTGMRVRVYK